MDERTWFFLYLLLSLSFFGVLGGAFGAFVGYSSWKSGRAAGTALGLAVVRAFTRLGDEPMAPTRQGALAGGVDGLAFGVLLGAVVGIATGWNGSDWRRLAPFMIAGVALAGGALALGLLARILVAGRSPALVGLFVGGIGGALGGFALYRVDGLYLGLLSGAFAGAVVGWVVRR